MLIWARATGVPNQKLDKIRKRAKKEQEANAAKGKLIADENDARRRFVALLSSRSSSSSSSSSSGSSSSGSSSCCCCCSSNSNSSSSQVGVDKEDYSCSGCDKVLSGQVPYIWRPTFTLLERQ